MCGQEGRSAPIKVDLDYDAETVFFGCAFWDFWCNHIFGKHYEIAKYPHPLESAFNRILNG